MVSREIWTILSRRAAEFRELARGIWQNFPQKTVCPTDDAGCRSRLNFNQCWTGGIQWQNKLCLLNLCSASVTQDEITPSGPLSYWERLVLVCWFCQCVDYLSHRHVLSQSLSQKVFKTKFLSNILHAYSAADKNFESTPNYGILLICYPWLWQNCAILSAVSHPENFYARQQELL